MSFMDNVRGIFTIDGDDDGFYDEEDTYLDDEPAPVKRAAVKEGEEEEPQSKRVPRQSTKPQRRSLGNGMEVCAIKPSVFEDAREITETLLSNRTVVLNLEGLDVDIAQRIIDFASGSCYAMRGNLQKISNYIFIITPASVDISGGFQDLISGTLDVEISR